MDHFTKTGYIKKVSVLKEKCKIIFISSDQGELSLYANSYECILDGDFLIFKNGKIDINKPCKVVYNQYKIIRIRNI